jgi:hypothetical protein
MAMTLNEAADRLENEAATLLDYTKNGTRADLLGLVVLLLRGMDSDDAIPELLLATASR